MIENPLGSGDMNESVGEGVEARESCRVDVDHGIEMMELVVSVCVDVKSPPVLVVETSKLGVSKSLLSDNGAIEED